jgi:NAD(P)-dependent dehydrogenase (short-subunit alcohol dehydrogenase family)
MTALLNKTALVTGASRGIGRATASALAAAGAHVLVHYGRSAQDAESLVADIRSKEGRADAIQADLGTPDGATLLAKEVRSIVGERLDVLVSNAGISKAATIKDHTEVATLVSAATSAGTGTSNLASRSSATSEASGDRQTDKGRNAQTARESPQGWKEGSLKAGWRRLILPQVAASRFAVNRKRYCSALPDTITGFSGCQLSKGTIPL